MKQLLALTMLVSLAMICSCQKQDSAAETQLAQRRAELDAREKAVEEREKAVAEREKAVANSRIIQPRAQVPDAAQAEAERQRRIQQLPPEVRSLIHDLVPTNPATAEKDTMTPERLAQRQRAPQDVQSQNRFEQARKALMSRAAISPAAEAASPTASPAVEATSPSPSPTPQ